MSALGIVSAEQSAAIKERIQKHLADEGVLSALKKIVAENLGGQRAGQSEEAVDSSALTAARRASVLAGIVADQAHTTPAPAPPSGHKNAFLHVHLLGGRAFALAEEEQGPEPDRGSICVCLQFGSQRFRSQAVPFRSDPQLSDGVLIELPAPDAATTAAMAELIVPSEKILEGLRGLCRACQPIHVLVLHLVGGRERLLSSVLLEWRSVLYCGRQTLSLELPGLGEEATLPLGALEFKLELLPQPRPESCLTEAELMLMLKAQRDAQVEAERKFFAYARSWWAEYTALNPAHASRAVKLFAMSELGTQRPVAAYLRPLRAERLLQTPRHAAHFVSLIRHEREPTAGASTVDVWRTVHATLALRGGEAEEHALLLCSLLLGFGLDAYVCLGTDGGGTHAWVLTRSVDGALTFWESLTGQQYPMPGPHPYTELACVFSHQALYANTQASASLEHCSLELDDPSAWMAMEPSLLSSVTPMPTAALRPSTLRDVSGLEHQCEATLRRLVDEHRAALGLASPGVVWDDELGYRLAPALASYETERWTGHTVDNAYFADAIRRKVPHGHTFKGFPHHFVTYEPATIFQTWLRDEVALSILQCRTSSASLAVRLHITPMPEDVLSVWAMIAIAYRPQ